MGALAMGYCIAARAMWGIAGCAAEVELLLLFFALRGQAFGHDRGLAITALCPTIRASCACRLIGEFCSKRLMELPYVIVFRSMLLDFGPQIRS